MLLRHELATGSHYDWLIARPGDERLWTARVAEPSTRWAELGRFELAVIGLHRREYLTYEGPVSGNRGTVRRVDAGEVRITAWSEESASLEVQMQGFCGTVRLTRQDAAGAIWLAETG